MRTCLAFTIVSLLVLLPAIDVPAQQASAQGQSPMAEPKPTGLIRTLAGPAFRHNYWVGALAQIDGGKQLITGGLDEGAILWDTATGKRLKTLVAGEVHRLAVSPAEDLLAVGTWRGIVAVNELASGKQRFAVQAHEAYPSALAFSRDGKLLASARDEEIRLWDAITGKAVGTLEGHTGKVKGVVFHTDGKSLLSTSADGTLRQWDLATGKEIRQIAERPGFQGDALALSRDGRTLAVVASDGGLLTHVRLVDTTTLKERFRAVLPAFHDACNVALSPDSRYVAATFYATRREFGVVGLWDTWTGKQIPLSSGNDDAVIAVCFLGDGKTLASGGADRMVRLWNVADGVQHALTKNASFEPAEVLALSPSGDRLALVRKYMTVQLWDTANGQVLDALPKSPISICALTFSPDGAMVLARPCPACFPSNDCLWNIRSGQLVPKPSDQLRQAFALSPDKKWLADPSTLPVDGRYGTCLWFSPDNALLYACQHTAFHAGTYKESYVIDVYETATGVFLFRAAAGEATAQGSWPTLGGTTLVVPSAPGMFRAIDLVTGQALGPDIRYGNGFITARFTSDGRLLALGHKDGSLELWHPPPLPPRKLLPAAITKDDLQTLWQALAGTDAKRAYDARWRLAAAPEQTLLLLKAQLRPPAEVEAKKIAAWVAQLDNNSFKEREVAKTELEKAGRAADSALRKALEQKPTLELRLRAEAILAKLTGPPTGETLRTLRSIVILEAIGNDEACAILQTLADDAADSRLTDAAQSARRRLQGRR